MSNVIKIGHLYPNEMNIYGDKGNILALKYRIEKRGYKFEYTIIDKENEFVECNMYFMGGGQDADMDEVYLDMLQNKKDKIKKEVEKGKVFLLICGGYQLFGEKFIGGAGDVIEGLDILDITTKALDTTVQSRCLGNIIVELSDDIYSDICKIYPNAPKTIVGFENHSGQTYFSSYNNRAIGKVLIGKGNNYEDRTEGYIYKNVFGSYMHGSFLPKNPHFADYLIYLCVKNISPTKNEKVLDFIKLDDKIELLAHGEVLNLYYKKL